MKQEKIRKNDDGLKGGQGRLALKLLIVVSVFLAFYTCYKLYHIIYRQNATSQEIAALQSEIDKLNQENKNMKELAEYLRTDSFKEKEVRDKFNMVKEGEEVFLIKEKEVLKEVETEEDAKSEVVINRPNYYYWWHYYFGLKD